MVIGLVLFSQEPERCLYAPLVSNDMLHGKAWNKEPQLRR